MFLLGSFDANKVDDNSRVVAGRERDEEPRRPDDSSCRDLSSSRKRSSTSLLSLACCTTTTTTRKWTLPLPSLPTDSRAFCEASREGIPTFTPSRAARNDAMSASESTSTGQRQSSRSRSYSTFESSHCPADAAAAKPPIPETPSPHPRHEWNTSNMLPRNEGRDFFVQRGSPDPSSSVMDRIRSLCHCCSNASKESSCSDDLPCFPFVATTVDLSKERTWWGLVFAAARVTIVAAAMVTATAWILHSFAPRSDEGRFEGWSPRERGSELVWRWDRNVYHPQPRPQPLAPTGSANDSDRTYDSSLTHANDPMGTEQRRSHSEAKDRQARRRNLLVVQIGGPQVDKSSNLVEPRAPSVSSLEDSSAPPWLEISSRPNRAYAKQWGMDYAVIYTPPSAVESTARQLMWPCNRERINAQRRGEELSRRRSQFGLDVISVLQTLLDRQETQYQEEPFGDMTHGDTQGQSDDSGVTYDSIILIPNNAVIIDLDYDLLRLIPEDKLAAVSWKSQGKDEGFDESDAGYDENHAMTLQGTLLVFNVRHPYSKPVVSKWSDLALEMSSVTAREQGSAAREVSSGAIESSGYGQAGDLRLLFQAIQNVELERNDESSSLVLNLTQSSDGFVGRDDDNPHAIKSISLYSTLLGPLAFKSNSTDVSMSGVPSASVMNAAFALQTAADSVCYRYYPKCEVL